MKSQFLLFALLLPAGCHAQTAPEKPVVPVNLPVKLEPPIVATPALLDPTGQPPTVKSESGPTRTVPFVKGSVYVDATKELYTNLTHLNVIRPVAFS